MVNVPFVIVFGEEIISVHFVSSIVASCNALVLPGTYLPALHCRRLTPLAMQRMPPNASRRRSRCHRRNEYIKSPLSYHHQLWVSWYVASGDEGRSNLSYQRTNPSMCLSSKCSVHMRNVREHCEMSIYLLSRHPVNCDRRSSRHSQQI